MTKTPRVKLHSEEIEAEISVLQKKLTTEYQTWRAIQSDWMAEQGYCPHCRGTGKIKYRDTIDYMHDYELVDCKCDTKRLPFGKTIDDLFPRHSDIVTMQEEVDRLKKMRDEVLKIEEHPIRRRVCVVKGRKVPKGTEGVCFWCGDSQFGKRVGIKTDEGETHWTAIENVVVIDW